MSIIPTQSDRERTALARMMMITGTALAAYRVPRQRTDSTALDAVARAVALRHLPLSSSDEYVAVVVDRQNPEQAPTVVRIPTADVFERVARNGFHKVPPATIKIHPVWCDQDKCDNGDGSVCHFGSVGTVPTSDGSDQEIKVELSVYEHAGADETSPRQAPEMPEIHVHGVDGDEPLTLENASAFSQLLRHTVDEGHRDMWVDADGQPVDIGGVSFLDGLPR